MLTIKVENKRIRNPDIDIKFSCISDADLFEVLVKECGFIESKDYWGWSHKNDSSFHVKYIFETKVVAFKYDDFGFHYEKKRFKGVSTNDFVDNFLSCVREFYGNVQHEFRQREMINGVKKC
tara:strand:+ start:1042 stop:1407 length:366 start_codon:yes stop_codon:yes gene_type:complete